jgi:RimJ/RimL family protein N-acetyltransferase
MNVYYIGSIPVSDELYHHGILGQKWGIRRFQNSDGTLTEEGKKRYGRNVSEQEAFNNFLKEDKRTQYEMVTKYGTVDSKAVKKDIKSGNKDALYDDFRGVQDEINLADSVARYNNEYDSRYNQVKSMNKDVESILNSLNDKDFEYLFGEGSSDGSERKFYTDSYLDKAGIIAKRIIEYDGDIPVSFFDLEETDNGSLNSVVATRSGDEYRRKGHAQKCVSEGLKWVEENKDRLNEIGIDTDVRWQAYDGNNASIKLAKKSGFKENENKRWYKDDNGWYGYIDS